MSNQISGTKKVQKEYEKSIGYFEAEVLKFNPDKSELEALLDTTVEKEPSYTGEKEGVKTATPTVWLLDVKTKKKLAKRFFIKDEDSVGKTSGKTEYINSIGDATWVMEEDQLPIWFKNFTVSKDDQTSKGTKTYRKAKIGEARFYKFLRSWIQLDWFDPTTKLIIDEREIMRGDLSSLNTLINTDLTTISNKGHEKPATVVCLATVRAVETTNAESGETEVKEYQDVYDAFMPGFYIKHLRTNNPNPPSLVKKFLEDIKGTPEQQSYICKDHYVLADLRDYIAGESPAAGEAKLTETDDDY